VCSLKQDGDGSLLSQCSFQRQYSSQFSHLCRPDKCEAFVMTELSLKAPSHLIVVRKSEST
jgi:hypothetical protein